MISHIEQIPSHHFIQYFESIVKAMPGNVYWLDQQCRMRGFNQNVMEMFGVNTVGQLVGADFNAMTELGGWTKEAGKSFEQDTRHVLETGMGVRNVEEPPIPGANGEMIYFLSSRMPLRDRVGQVIGVVGVSIDITDYRQALCEKNRASVGAAQAKLIRQLRTPLSPYKCWLSKFF